MDTFCADRGRRVLTVGGPEDDGVDLRPEQQRNRRDEEVEQEHDDPAQAAVDGVEVREIREVDRKTDGRDDPRGNGNDRPRRNDPERLVDVREEVVDERDGHGHQQQGDRDAEPRPDRDEYAAEPQLVGEPLHGLRTEQEQHTGDDQGQSEPEGEEDRHRVELPDRSPVLHVVGGVDRHDDGADASGGGPDRADQAERQQPAAGARADLVDDPLHLRRHLGGEGVPGFLDRPVEDLGEPDSVHHCQQEDQEREDREEDAEAQRARIGVHVVIDVVPDGLDHHLQRVQPLESRDRHVLSRIPALSCVRDGPPAHRPNPIFRSLMFGRRLHPTQ
jgi:hypothetical protein